MAAAEEMSASSRITAADLPPSSSVNRAMRSPQIEPIVRPAAVEPVNDILSTRTSRTSISDTSRSAVITFNTPAGSPIDSATSASRYAAPGGFRRRFEHYGAAGQERGGELVGD